MNKNDFRNKTNLKTTINEVEFMAITNGEYGKMAKKASPPSKKVKNGLLAFLTGGIICASSEGLITVLEKIGTDADDIKAIIPVTLIVITSILTSLGVFDKIAYFAGAGTVVPITGFANSIVSAAMEHRSEGRILGTGANMFKIAGPVLAYGSFATVIYGIIYYLFLK